MKNKKGFTLIEIMIVVVIIGVLASLALPKLGNQVKKAAAAEAFSMLGSMVRASSNCYMMQDEDYTKCNDKGLIETATGSSFPDSKNFTYTLSTASSATHTFQAAYTGSTGGNIYMTIDLTSGKTAKCSNDSTFNQLKGVEDKVGPCTL